MTLVCWTQKYIQSNLPWRPPLERDHLSSETRSWSHHQFLLYNSPLEGDHLPNETMTSDLRSDLGILYWFLTLQEDHPEREDFEEDFLPAFKFYPVIKWTNKNDLMCQRQSKACNYPLFKDRNSDGIILSPKRPSIGLLSNLCLWWGGGQ